MITYYNHDHALHKGRVEMFRGRMVPCFEVPERVDHVLAELTRRSIGPIQAPQEWDDCALAAIHDLRYLDFLSTAWQEWVALDAGNAQCDAIPSVWPIRGMRSDQVPENFAARMGLFSFDAGSPLTSGTWRAARLGAQCALSAAQCVADGARSAFALTRPPGHHAGADYFGGYCFLNNAALGAQQLRNAGATKVAVLDIDYHHGNGTQDIFYKRADVLFVSVHGDPRTEYPFFLGHSDERGAAEGLGFNLNLPLPKGSDYANWSQALEQGLLTIESFGADALVVSMGMDTFAGDPISGFTLQSDDYLRIGERLLRLGMPTVFVFEGGYAVHEIGVNAVNVLQAFV